MYKCTICHNKIHKDDLLTITSPAGGCITNVCPTCISSLDERFYGAVEDLREMHETYKREIKLKQA